MMDELRYVLTGGGALCVMISGTLEMLKWSVDNWDMMDVSCLPGRLTLCHAFYHSSKYL